MRVAHSGDQHVNLQRRDLLTLEIQKAQGERKHRQTKTSQRLGYYITFRIQIYFLYIIQASYPGKKDQLLQILV